MTRPKPLTERITTVAKCLANRGREAYMKTPLDFCGFQLIGCVTYVTAAVTARRRHTVRLIAHAGSAQSTSSRSLSGRNRTLLDETARAAVTLAQGILD